MEMHCTGNPFIDKFPLKSLVSSAIVPTEAKNDIINFDQKGQLQFEQFVETRLLSTSSSSVWDTMKKMKLKLSQIGSNCVKRDNYWDDFLLYSRVDLSLYQSLKKQLVVLKCLLYLLPVQY